jgi:hypothetical protein
MIEDELVALAIYSGAAALAVAIYVRGNVRALRWSRRMARAD